MMKLQETQEVNLHEFEGQRVHVKISAPVMRNAAGRAISRGGSYNIERSEHDGILRVFGDFVQIVDETGRMIVAAPAASVRELKAVKP